MQRYTITAGDEELSIMARAHRQHIWSKTTLLGVSKEGKKRLDRFLSRHAGKRISVNAGPYRPELVGYECDS